MQPEIVKGTQQPALKGIPESQLHRNAPVEAVEQVSPSARRAWRSGRAECEAADSERCLVSTQKVFEQAPIRGRRGVVELVDDHYVKRRRVDLLQLHLCERLNRGKDVPPLVRPMAVHVEFTEVS